MKKYFRYLIVITMFVAITVSCKLEKYLVVTFDSNEGSFVEAMLVKNGEKIYEPEAPIRDIYRFDGWFTDNNTFANKWNFDENIVTEDITLYAKWKIRDNIEEFTVSTLWLVPEGVTSVDVFCVGGGGSGAGDFILANHSGSGGNGGVVTYTPNVTVTPGKWIQITVGAGGISGKRDNGTPGGTSSFGNAVSSSGGFGGKDGQPEEQENSGRGGSRGGFEYTADTDFNGGDGIECPFYSTGEKYGAGGAGAYSAYIQTFLQQLGGDTGGGNSGYGDDNTPENRGSDATFYGGGGGGGAFSSEHTYSLG